MRAHQILTGFLALVAGCGSRETPVRADSTPPAAPVDTAPALSVAPKFTNLTCSPTVLRSSDVLSMKMQGPHGATLMAVAPDRTRYFVIFEGEGAPSRGKRKSLSAPDVFLRTPELNVDPRMLTGGVLVSGRDTNEVVFRTPGVYRLVVGSHLETDRPEYAECLVRYAS